MNEPVLEILKGIERPSRYVGGEYGLPPLNLAAEFSIAFGFPDVYEVGMSHLGYRLLHASLLSRTDLQVERVFLPWPDLQARLRQKALPLFSLETHRPIAQFQILGLSLQYELAMPTILTMLDLAQIPRLSAERAASDQHWPLILVGGSGALNPEPLCPFVDCFFIGEADQSLHTIVDCVKQHHRAPRSTLLQALAQIDGLYIPELVDMEYTGLAARPKARPPAKLPIVRQYIPDLDQLEIPTPHLVPHCTPIHDRVSIEIQRGCSQGCRFCQAGFISRPTRQRSAVQVQKAARRYLKSTGYENLSLLSLSAGDHPCLQSMLAALIKELHPSRVAISLPSMRTESLPPEVAEQISKVRKTGFTLAPEAGTERLRRVINKGNTEADLMRSIRSVIRAGYAHLKLYFMIGLPTETKDDVLAIAALCERALEEAKTINKRARLTAAVSTFVPKPHTPFQWEAAPDLEQIRAAQQLIQSRIPRRVSMKWHDAGQSLVESYLARADRRMAAVLQLLVTDDYLGMDAWTDQFDLGRWQRALQKAHDSGDAPAPADWLAQRDPALPLPWDHLDVGVERQYLLQQRQDALAEKTRPDCSDGACDACGVCPADPLHQLRPEPPAPPVEASDDLPEETTPLRIWFKKVAGASLISHLEMVRTFERACRRAELPLAFTQGFHPKPKLRFTPALPLGAESHCEFLEITLLGTPDPEEVQTLLTKELPPGFLPFRAELAPQSLLPQIQGIHWRITLPRPARERLTAAQDRLAAGPLLIKRKGGKEVDRAAQILAFQVLDDTSIEVHCRFDEQGTIRPQEILKELIGLGNEEMAQTSIIRWTWVNLPTG